jgi:hypothetical protein
MLYSISIQGVELWYASREKEKRLSTQRIVLLLVSYLVITAFAFVSEKSRVLAAVIAVFPINVTLGIWFVYTNTHGNPQVLADFLRMLFFGLVPALLFVAACWFGVHRGWSFDRILLLGGVTWIVAMAAYRGIEWQLGLHQS